MSVFFKSAAGTGSISVGRLDLSTVGKKIPRHLIRHRDKRLATRCFPRLESLVDQKACRWSAPIYVQQYEQDSTPVFAATGRVRRSLPCRLEWIRNRSSFSAVGVLSSNSCKTAGMWVINMPDMSVSSNKIRVQASSRSKTI